MSKTIGWDRRLAVSASGKNLVGHAGAVLLRACADRTGLTGALSGVMPSSAAAGWWDRGVTLRVTNWVTIGADARGLSRTVRDDAARWAPG